MPVPDDRTSTRLVDALNALFGRHPGARAAHAKGICCRGSFRATPEASQLTRAAHMSGREVPVTVRFSNGAGHPGLPDGMPDGRGLAVRFHLPDGGHTDLLSITTPIFPARVPEDFIELISVLLPEPGQDGPNPRKIEEFKKAHPELRAAVELALAPPVLASYAQRTYWAVHAFRFTNAAGREQYIRYTWRPDAGTVTAPERKDRDASYLQSELRARLAEQPVIFTLHVQLAEPGDDVNDPARAWPHDRRSVLAGVLEISGVVADQAGGCEALIFDPSALTDGIAMSDDAILNARPGAYSVSYKRRTSP
jgi:catalase